MSTSSAAHIEAGAQLAAAMAANLAAKPGQQMTAGSVADILGSVLATVPALSGSPEASLVIALASIALRAFHAATTTGEGLTPLQRAALVADDDAAIAADKAAHPSTIVAQPPAAVTEASMQAAIAASRGVPQPPSPPIPVQVAALRPLVAPMAAGQG